MAERSRRLAEDKGDEIPKDWQNKSFATDRRRDTPAVQLTAPQKYREWFISKRTVQEANKALPLYRIPQLAYMTHMYRQSPNTWSHDAEGRIYCFVPHGDEVSDVLKRDVHSDEWLLYVVLPNSKLEFPRDKIQMTKPVSLFLTITFSDFQQGRAVGVAIVKTAGNRAVHQKQA